jgi:hypothetical protein
LLEESDLGLDNTDAVRDNFEVFVSLFSSGGVSITLVVAVLFSVLEFGLLLNDSLSLFVSFVVGDGDSLVEGGDFTLELGDLEGELVELGISSGFVVIISGDPSVVGSSFDFSGVSDLFEEVVAEFEDLVDGRLVGLDGSSGGDGGEELEHVAPGLSLELEVSGLGEVVGEVEEDVVGGGLFEERTGEASVDELLGGFNDEGGSVVLGGDVLPLLVLFGLGVVEGVDFFDGVGRLLFSLGEEFVLFVSSGDLFVEFGSKFVDSVGSGADFVGESGLVAFARGSEVLDVSVVALLFSHKAAFDVTEHVEEVVDGIAGFELELDGVQEGLSELGVVDLLESLNGFLVLSESEGADAEKSADEESLRSHWE